MREGGGVRKLPKKCHVLFEWPLNTKTVNPCYSAVHAKNKKKKRNCCHCFLVENIFSETVAMNFKFNISFIVFV